MIKINDKVYHYIDHVNKIEYSSEYIFLYSKTKKYLYINRKVNDKLYNYFESINFFNYLKKINDHDDSFSLFIIEHNNNSFIDTLCDLGIKSFRKIKVDDEILKKIYDDVYIKIDSLYKYYLNMQDKIEELAYPNEAEYNLIINISHIYHLLDMGKYFLNKWFNEEHNFLYENYTLNNMSYKNFIDGNIIFLDGNFELTAYFFDKIYKNMYLSNDLFSDMGFLISNIKIAKADIYLFYAMISISRKITANDIVEVNSLIMYTKETYDYLLKKYEENKESN